MASAASDGSRCDGGGGDGAALRLIAFLSPGGPDLAGAERNDAWTVPRSRTTGEPREAGEVDVVDPCHL